MYFIGLIKDEKVWTIGCLLTIKEALQAVQDSHDFGVLGYNYLVIEQIGLGIHPKVKNSWFFKWDNNVRIPKPIEFEKITNFTIG